MPFTCTYRTLKMFRLFWCIFQFFLLFLLVIECAPNPLNNWNVSTCTGCDTIDTHTHTYTSYRKSTQNRQNEYGIMSNWTLSLVDLLWVRSAHRTAQRHSTTNVSERVNAFLNEEKKRHLFWTINKNRPKMPQLNWNEVKKKMAIRFLSLNKKGTNTRTHTHFSLFLPDIFIYSIPLPFAYTFFFSLTCLFPSELWRTRIMYRFYFPYFSSFVPLWIIW